MGALNHGEVLLQQVGPTLPVLLCLPPERCHPGRMLERSSVFSDSLSSLRKEQLCGGGERRIQKWVKWKPAKILQIYKEQQTLISLRKGRCVCL